MGRLLYNRRALQEWRECYLGYNKGHFSAAGSSAEREGTRMEGEVPLPETKGSGIRGELLISVLYKRIYLLFFFGLTPNFPIRYFFS